MFEILYRITDKLEYLKNLKGNSFENGGDIEGFFLISVNGYSYGHYHNRLLGDDEMGWYCITEWFVKLVVAYKELSKSGYVAINDTDSFNNWIEIKKQKGQFIISIVEANKEDGSSELRLLPFKEFNYGKWKNIIVDKTEYLKELSYKISLFIEEIKEINKEILKNKKFVELNRLLVDIKKENI